MIPPSFRSRNALRPSVFILMPIDRARDPLAFNLAKETCIKYAIRSPYSEYVEIMYS
jgi:hypothetical protein